MFSFIVIIFNTKQGISSQFDLFMNLVVFYLSHLFSGKKVKATRTFSYKQYNLLFKQSALTYDLKTLYVDATQLALLATLILVKNNKQKTGHSNKGHWHRDLKLCILMLLSESFYIHFQVQVKLSKVKVT
jgi:hypothetical protein